MDLLLIGGTQFVGRALVEKALERGHKVTMFNRGKTNPDLFPEVERIIGDRDGDLVADTPTDASQWLDPDPLIFAYTPVEDPAVYKTAWSDFLSHLEAKTGKKVTKTKVTKPDGTVKKVRRVERPNGVTTRKLSIKRPVHTK